MRRFLRNLVPLFLIMVMVVLALAPSKQNAPNTVHAASQSNEPQVTAWQTGGSGVRAVNAQSGKLNFIGFGSAEGATSITNATAAVNAIQPYAAEFGLTNVAQQLQFVSSTRGQTGNISYRFQQYHQGVPVLGGEFVVNVDTAGRLKAISGEASVNVTVPTTPTVNSSAAVQNALAYISKGFSLNPAELTASAPSLWIYDSLLISPYAGPLQLVWRLDVSSVQGKPIKFLVLVNAQRGGVVLAFNQIDTFWGEAVAARQSNTNTEPRTDGTLPRLPGFNATATTFNSNNSSDLQGTGASTLVCTTTQPGLPDQLMGPNSCDGGAAASRANAAHFFALNTFDYFDANHGRNSIDNAGMTLISNVEFTPNPPATFFNAFWDGTQMVYGNADFFSADDIVGHELTHGVTERSSNLFYYYESGAINESFSDVFGEFVDLTNGIDSFGNPDNAANRWDLAEDLSIGAIRDMQNPPTFGDPDRTRSPLYFAPGGVTYGANGDQGGVHFNSGVNNKATYLITDGDTFNGFTVTGIGIPKTSAIYYEVNTTLLTSGADYGVLYGALNQACQNLIGGPLGITAADCVEVNEAALATEMNLEPAYDGFSPETTPTCPNPQDTPVILFQDDFEGGIGNFNFVNLSGTGFWINTTAFPGISYATSGVESLYGEDTVFVDHYATLDNAIPLTGGVEYFLFFRHSYGFEDYQLFGFSEAFDGGVIEYTTNGTTWTDIQPLFNAGLNYNVTIDASFGNPLGPRPAFGYDSHGYVSTRYNLTSLANQTVNFRWRIGSDTSVFDLGWFFDDVQVYSCGTVTPPPPPPPPDTGGPGPTVTDPGLSKIGVLAPGQLGLPGEQITWTITATAPGAVALTNVVVSDTFRPELRINSASSDTGTVSVSGQTVTWTIPFLSAGSSAQLRVVTTVVSNPVGGVFENTVFLNADNGVALSATARVSGVSGLPDTGYPPSND